MSEVAGTVVVRGRCLSYGESMSLHLVADLLRSLCQLGESDEVERARSHVDTMVDSLLAPHDDETRAAARDVLGTLLGLPPAESGVTHASPQIRRQTLVRSLQLVLSALSTFRPAVVLLEDLHWADTASLEMMEEVLRVLNDRRAIVLDTHRPGREVAWETWPQGRTVILEPLGTGEALELARAVAGGTPLDPSLEAEIIDRTGGNPFFVEELLRSMKETGALVERDGHLCLKPESAGELPSTLTELLLARLDQLERPARAAAQLGSVIGRIFAVPVLSRVAGQQEDELREPLDSLERAAIAFPRLNRAQEYVFKHATVREVAYNTLLLRRRRALHAAAARAIIELYPADEHVDVIAYHFSQTRENAEAALWLERAADRAAAIFANAEAIEKYREARRRQDLIDAPVQDRARVDEKMGHILRVLVRFDEGLESLDAALGAYGASGDLEGTRRVAAEIGRLHRAQGTPQEGVEIIRQRLEAESAGPPTSGLAALHVALARLYYNEGKYHEQLEAASLGSQMAAQVGDRRVLAEAEMSRSVALYHLRRTEEALFAMEAAIPIAEEVEDFEVLAILLGNTAMIYRDAGDFERSRVFRERSVHLAERVGDIGWLSMALGNLGELVFCLGSWNEAQKQLERAVEITRPLGSSWFSPHAPMFLAQLHAARGEYETANAYLEEPLKVAREGGIRMLLIIPVAFQAEMEILRGEPEQALHVLEEIMDFSNFDEDDATLTGVLPIAAWALLEAGQPVRAAELAALGVERATEERATVEVMTNQRVLGAAAVALGDWETAETNLGESLAMARALKFPYAEGRVLYEYGVLRQRQGRGTEARRMLEEGLKIFSRLGARPYLDRIHRALSQLAA
jgi:adenylate cyclase